MLFRNRRKKYVYSADGMHLEAKHLGFLTDPRFVRAYNRGMNSGHHIGRDKGSTADIHIEYRVYIECWAAEACLRLDGDFVCCGVNTGIMPLAICDYTDFNSTDKRIWLFDTFTGIPENQMSASERAPRTRENADHFSDCYAIAAENFAPFARAKLVRGMVPDTLATVPIDRVAYLAIDMNIAYPERKAIEYFWPKLSTGALVVLDDYGWTRYAEQRISMDEFAASVGVSVLTLPTGQGLMMKPAE
jgi:O-methyltransferase